jgi:DNA polymerase-4
LKQASLAGRTITLNPKTADFRSRMRSRRLANPTQMAGALFRTAGRLCSPARWHHLVSADRVEADALLNDLTADPPTLFSTGLGGSSMQ